jgi:hypothetical protein
MDEERLLLSFFVDADLDDGTFRLTLSKHQRCLLLEETGCSLEADRLREMSIPVWQHVG